MAKATTTSDLAKGLRDLADFYDANPHLDVSYVTAQVLCITLGSEPIAAYAATPGGWEKNAYDVSYGGNFELKRAYGPVQLSVVTGREEVCEKVVVGTEQVEVVDPNAPKVIVEREVVEWKCRPLLASEVG